MIRLWWDSHGCFWGTSLLTSNLSRSLAQYTQYSPRCDTSRAVKPDGTEGQEA